jgi:cytochrome c553
VRIKVLAPVIIIGFIVALTYHFIALAAIDAPHNDANSVSCGSCHGEGLLQSFWGGSGLYSTVDALCLSCHKRPFGPYTDDDAPVVKTHSSENTSEQYGVWAKECVNCHDPHYQKQKNFKNTNASDLYLASGKIISYVYNGDGTSTLSYETITYKPGWDAEKILKKTDKYRRTILFPNVGKLGFSYPVIGIDEDTEAITVKGDVTPVYQYITTSSYAIMYGQYVKDTIDGKEVKFFDQDGEGSFADGQGVLIFSKAEADLTRSIQTWTAEYRG